MGRYRGAHFALFLIPGINVTSIRKSGSFIELGILTEN